MPDRLTRRRGGGMMSRSSRFDAVLRALPPHLATSLGTLIEATEYRLHYYRQNGDVVVKLANVMMKAVDEFAARSGVEVSDVQVTAAALIVIVSMLELGLEEAERRARGGGGGGRDASLLGYV